MVDIEDTASIYKTPKHQFPNVKPGPSRPVKHSQPYLHDRATLKILLFLWIQLVKEIKLMGVKFMVCFTKVLIYKYLLV